MLKVAIIGGGSTYTPELIQGFLHCAGTFPRAYGSTIAFATAPDSAAWNAASA